VNARTFVLIPLAGLCACQNMPPPYAPPAQRHPFESARPYRMARIVDMDDGDAPKHFVRDISSALVANWRWTGQHPAVRVLLPSNKDLFYTIDFTIPEISFRQTGPVTVSFYVNGHFLDRVHCTSPGTEHFEKPVPESWVQPNQDATAEAEIDKMYVSPKDGKRSGFVLTRIGFEQAEPK
jgi:hypothetical protein